jgi:hypothetical protein
LSEITKEQAEAIDAAWHAASPTERLTMKRLQWISSGDRTSYFENEPSNLERQAATRIAELETALHKIADADTYTGGGAGTNLGRCIDIARRALAKST